MTKLKALSLYEKSNLQWSHLEALLNSKNTWTHTIIFTSGIFSSLQYTLYLDGVPIDFTTVVVTPMTLVKLSSPL